MNTFLSTLQKIGVSKAICLYDLQLQFACKTGKWRSVCGFKKKFQQSNLTVTFQLHTYVAQEI
jgi:hypothetical protein